MNRARNTALLIRAAAPAAIALLVIVHFAGFALFGANGLFAWGDYKRALMQREQELVGAEKERAQLQHHAALLDPRKVDPDYADELVRRETGQVRPDEVIIPRR